MLTLINIALFASGCIALIWLLQKVVYNSFFSKYPFFEKIVFAGFTIIFFRFLIHYYNILHDYLWKWANQISMGETVMWLAGMIIVVIISVLCAQITVKKIYY